MTSIPVVRARSRFALRIAPGLAACLLHASSPAGAQSPTPADASAARTTPAPSVPVAIDGGVFGKVGILPPAGGAEIRSVALFLAPDGEADVAAQVIATRLTELNTLVVPVDPAAWLATIEPGPAGCANLAASLDALGRTAQDAVGTEGHIAPMLVSRGIGSPLAYAALLQAAPETFKGAVTIDFCPKVETHVPLCAGTELAGRALARGAGTALDAPSQATAPLTVLHSGGDGSCTGVDVSRYVSGIEGATLVDVPETTARYPADATLMSLFEDAYLSVAGSDSAMRTAAGSLPDGLRNLPLTEVVDPKAPSGDTFAVLYSGDGGWADLDDGVAHRLAAAGVPTVGVSSLKYFWTARTPDGMATDFERIAAHYAAAWKRSKVLLVGYSLGADVAPFIASRAVAGAAGAGEATPSLAALGLLAPGREAAFQFHLSDWLKSSDDGTPISPEMAKLGKLPVVCAYGEDEASDSLCTTSAVPKARAHGFPGGHHLDGDYAGIAALLLGALPAAK